MENINYYKSVLLELIDVAEKIESQWSGEESGLQEENARTASDIRTKILELIKLINEIK